MGQERRSETMGGRVRLTEFASPQHCCCALFWTFSYGTYKKRSPICSMFIRAFLGACYIYISCPEEERSITENTLVM